MRKAANKIPMDKPDETPVKTTEQETVSLQFVEADDTIPPEKPSRLKKAFTQVFTTTDEEDKPTKKTRKKSTFFVKNTELVVGGMLFCIHLLVPDEYKEIFYVNEQPYQYLPTEKQLSDILTPIARIADRHTHIADINPDVLDVLACGQSCAAYGMELRATIILKAYIDKKAKQDEKVKNMQHNGFKPMEDVWKDRINGYNAQYPNN